MHCHHYHFQGITPRAQGETGNTGGSAVQLGCFSGFVLLSTVKKTQIRHHQYANLLQPQSLGFKCWSNSSLRSSLCHDVFLGQKDPGDFPDGSSGRPGGKTLGPKPSIGRCRWARTWLHNLGIGLSWKDLFRLEMISIQKCLKMGYTLIPCYTLLSPK